MNILTSLLRDHPQSVKKLLNQEVVRLDSLVDVLTELDSFPFVLDYAVAARIVSQEPLGTQLGEGYLPVIATDDWRARTEPARLAEPVPATEWVTFVEVRGTDRGLTLPEDDSATPAFRSSPTSTAQSDARASSTRRSRAKRSSSPPGLRCLSSKDARLQTGASVLARNAGGVGCANPVLRPRACIRG